MSQYALNAGIAAGQFSQAGFGVSQRRQTAAETIEHEMQELLGQLSYCAEQAGLIADRLGCSNSISPNVAATPLKGVASGFAPRALEMLQDARGRMSGLREQLSRLDEFI